VSVFGVWRSKAWGVALYIAGVGIEQLFLLSLRGWNVAALVIPLVFIVPSMSLLKATQTPRRVVD
jgi:hypothetical protein